MNGIKAYQETAISTQSKGKLIVMLYEGAIKFLKIAVTGIEEKDYAKKGTYIGKALDIIDELNVVLDMDAGGQISQNLRALYVFMTKHLNQANIQCDAEKVKEVIGLLEELNQGWKAITN